LGVQLIPFVVRGPDDFEGAFRAMTKERANGLFMRLQAFVYSAHFKRVVELTIKNRLPSISSPTSVVSHAVCTLSKTALAVIPAEAGIQNSSEFLDSGSR